MIDVDDFKNDPSYGMDDPISPFESKSSNRLSSLNDFLSDIKEGAIIHGLIRLEDDFFNIKRIESGFHGAGIKFKKEVKYNKEKKVDDIWYTITNYHRADVHKKIIDIVMKKQNRLNPSASDAAVKDNYLELTADIIAAIKKSAINFIDKTRDQVAKHLSRTYGIKVSDVESVLNKLDFQFANEKLMEIGTLELGGGAERAMDNTLDNLAYAASNPRLPTFESWYSNYAGFGISPLQTKAPFLSFNRMPAFHAYMRQFGGDLRIP